MIREIRIQSVQSLLPLLTEQEYRRDLDRYRSSYLYRGMPDVEFNMVTSLRRNCKQLQKTLEPAILQNFAKYAVREDPSVARNRNNRKITTTAASSPRLMSAPFRQIL